MRRPPHNFSRTYACNKLSSSYLYHSCSFLRCVALRCVAHSLKCTRPFQSFPSRYQFHRTACFPIEPANQCPTVFNKVGIYLIYASSNLRTRHGNTRLKNFNRCTTRRNCRFKKELRLRNLYDERIAGSSAMPERKVALSFVDISDTSVDIKRTAGNWNESRNNSFYHSLIK